MTTFAEKYAHAPALREITADEVKCGQVIRAVWVYSNDLTVAWIIGPGDWPTVKGGTDQEFAFRGLSN